MLVVTLLWPVNYVVSIPALTTSKPEQFTRPKVLLLSVGGFKLDYLNLTQCPTLEQLIHSGTVARYVQNSINTASLVNHYSIATGLFPESHGIISSTMFDPTINRVFSRETREESAWWENVHPVWKDIEKQGRGKSGVCRWPGVYGSMLPSLNCQGKHKSFKNDIDRAIEWFEHEGTDLVLLYTDDIKTTALKWGPNSKQVINEMKVFDFLLNYLLRKIRDYNLNVNILLTTDHGVTELNWDHVIDLDKCIDHNSYILLHSQGTLLFYPKRGHTLEEIYGILKGCPYMSVYLKDDLPSHYHFSHHRRIPPIIAFVPLGATVRSSKNSHRKIDEMLKGSPMVSRNLGATGYDPDYKEMKSVFLASGPSFRSGLITPAINNTDIYSLVCYLLGVQPRANNGSLDVVKSMLTETALSVDTKTSPSSSKDDRSTPERHRIDRSHGLLGDLEVRGLFWFLVASTTLLFLVCCIGCINSMIKNTRGFSGKTSVHAPATRKLLAYSSDED